MASTFILSFSARGVGDEGEDDGGQQQHVGLFSCTFLQFHSLVSQSQREFWVLESKPTLPIGCYWHTKWFSTVPKSIHKNKKTQPPISLTCEDK